MGNIDGENANNKLPTDVAYIVLLHTFTKQFVWLSKTKPCNINHSLSLTKDIIFLTGEKF